MKIKQTNKHTIAISHEAPYFTESMVDDFKHQAKFLASFRRVFLSYTLSDRVGFKDVDERESDESSVLPTLILEKVLVDPKHQDLRRLKMLMDYHFGEMNYRVEMLTFGDWWSTISSRALLIKGMES